MKVAVISDDTFDKESLKKYIEFDDKYTLGCVVKDIALAHSYLNGFGYDVIVVDYYNKKFGIEEIIGLGNEYSGALLVLLADVDESEELELLKNLEVEFATIYNLKEAKSEKDFVEHLDAMFDVMNKPETHIGNILLWLVALIIVFGTLYAVFFTNNHPF
ncbi:hypothetical protein HDR58_01275 [bacterium]|nr:hypothetical protein [bacterium]